VVVNTCTVTSIADSKSRQAIGRARRNNPAAQVLATGCSVHVDRATFAAIDPSARLFDNASKDRLLAVVSDLLDQSDEGPMPTMAGVVPVADAFDPPGPGLAPERTDIGHKRAFVKIQDGCSFHCTYCIIPRARGAERSIPGDAVLGEVARAVAAGHREVVLTGINAGAYSDGDLNLAGLVRRILGQTDVERIRLSSIEPQHLDSRLLDVWAGSGGRCQPHLHVPLQSGDDAILRRMGRRYDTASYAGRVDAARRAIPGVAIHADVIAGFPGEDEAAWARTLAVLRGLDLAGIHVFRYSARPGTPAARMIGQVDARTRKRRSAEALALAGESQARFAAAQVGVEMRVLFEKRLPDGRWLGHAGSHVLVAAAPRDGASVENWIGLVRGLAVDPLAPDRVLGELLSLHQPRIALGSAATAL
jgi:threonylcarbamoyladenosine tRNA methylthiotransferase MtaB